MTNAGPAYDRHDLQLFLHAQVKHAGAMASCRPASEWATDPDRRNAELGEKTRLCKAASLSRDVFALAWSGRDIDPEHQLRLWHALGVNPDLGRDAR